MSGFIRRFSSNPGAAVLSAIEGVNIIDNPPPASLTGVGTGVVCMVGEFQDMGFAVSVDGTGVVSTSPQPKEVFSSQDMANKFGGFDETIGNFGGGDGNAFVALRNKFFSRLVCVAVNLCSDHGIRVWRQLPTNKSSTVPTPVVPMQAAVVAAGREFKNASNRARLGTKVVFTDTDAYTTGTDGSVTAVAAAVTQIFSAASGNFVALGVKKGDILVLGVIGGAAGLGANAATYRVVSVTDATDIVVEKMDGSSFAWTTTASMPWRLHVGTTADSGALNSFTEPAGYIVPARPLDATINQALALSPTVAPPANAATSWDPLSGLAGATHPSSALTFTSTIQAPNAANDSTIDVLYQTAIDSLLQDLDPMSEINIVLGARHSTNINAKLKSHELDANARGLSRMAVISPPINTTSLDTVGGDTAPGVGANRDESVIYDWPGAMTFIPEAVNFKIATADGKTTTDGNLDVTFDTYMASILSNLSPFRNPGQIADPIPRVLSSVIGFSRGTPALGLPEYEFLKRKGVAALRKNKLGFFVQSGVTTSITPGFTGIRRRRTANFIEDSLAQITLPFTKIPLSPTMIDTSLGEVTAFLDDLLSPTNPQAALISGYTVDDKSGNTKELLAAGIFVIVVNVQTTPDAADITLSFNIGDGVQLQQQ